MRNGVLTTLSQPSIKRIEEWRNYWNPDWKSFLFYGSITNDVFEFIFEKNSDCSIFWFPLEQTPRLRGRCSDLKKKYGEHIKIFPGELTHQFKAKKPFDVIYWNGSHVFQKLIHEFNTLFRHSSTLTQWIAFHVAPQRNWGKYPYGYIRLGVECQWIKVNQWIEESSDRCSYDDAWCWFQFIKRPPFPDKIDENSWSMSVENRLYTGTPEWKLRERKVRITEWTAVLDKAKNADDYEELSKELQQILVSPFDEVDEWSVKVWNNSPGRVLQEIQPKFL